MSDELWIEIPNWDRFQHYRDRNPPWIKNYLELLHDDNYLSLTGHERAVLHGLWLEYASSRRRLRLDTRSISARLNLRVTTATLERLNHAGFVTLSASKALAPRVARGEAEQEKEKSLPAKEASYEAELETLANILGQAGSYPQA